MNINMFWTHDEISNPFLSPIFKFNIMAEITLAATNIKMNIETNTNNLLAIVKLSPARVLSIYYINISAVLIKFLTGEDEVSPKIFLPHYRIFRKLLTCSLEQNLSLKQKVCSVGNS